jgi:hypothetical protein
MFSAHSYTSHQLGNVSLLHSRTSCFVIKASLTLAYGTDVRFLLYSVCARGWGLGLDVVGQAAFLFLNTCGVFVP